MKQGKIFNVIKVTPPGHVLTYEFDYYVWIYAKDFKNIFGRQRNMSGRGHYVKLLSGSKTIYRAVETTGWTGVKASTVGLSYNSLCDLGIDIKRINNNRVIIKRVSTFRYLWFHPDYTQRWTCRFACLSFLVGLLLGAIL